MRHAQIAARVFNTPLMVDAAKLNAARPFLTQELLGARADFIVGDGVRFAPEPPERHMGKLGFTPDAYQVDHREDELVRRTQFGVGLICVEGTLVNKGGWIGLYSGNTSYQGIMAQVAEARADDSIRAVVFEIDSYGGEVSGAFDCAESIRELSEEKPTMAILTDSAYSAGYLLASQCRQIVLPASGGCGSIGVVTMHVDWSKAVEEMGAVVTLLAAGAHKTDGNMYEALPKDVADRYLSMLETDRQLFAEAVAAGRGDRLTRADAIATEAACYFGDEAVQAGLADVVARPSEAFKAFVNAFPAT